VPDERVKRPPLTLLAMEQRAVIEYWAGIGTRPLLNFAGRGDRHPVLVIPGFMAGDRSTAALRAVIRSNGYWTHAWRLGRNLGPTPEAVDGLRDRLLELHARHGRRVTLVGQSLGGIFARNLAREHPHSIRQVITLSSPFRLRADDETSLSWVAERLGFRPPASPEWQVLEEDRPPLTVPATAIYTRTDGIVRYYMCIEAEGPFRENIEVRGSHSGLAYNPATLIAILDRLAQPENDWRPFRPPPGTRTLFPQPAVWRERVTT
jgi:pimeloyl-ACP methyl ester carboxylesterase